MLLARYRSASGLRHQVSGMHRRARPSGPGRQQRQAKARAARKPQAGTIAGVAIRSRKFLEDPQQTARSDRITPRQRPRRVAETYPDRQIDVTWSRDALLRNIAGDVDDMRQRSLDDKARTVVNDVNRDAVRAKHVLH